MSQNVMSKLASETLFKKKFLVFLQIINKM